MHGAFAVFWLVWSVALTRDIGRPNNSPASHHPQVLVRREQYIARKEAEHEKQSRCSFILRVVRISVAFPPTTESEKYPWRITPIPDLGSSLWSLTTASRDPHHGLRHSTKYASPMDSNPLGKVPAISLNPVSCCSIPAIRCDRKASGLVRTWVGGVAIFFTTGSSARLSARLETKSSAVISARTFQSFLCCCHGGRGDTIFPAIRTLHPTPFCQHFPCHPAASQLW